MPTSSEKVLLQMEETSQCKTLRWIWILKPVNVFCSLNRGACLSYPLLCLVPKSQRRVLFAFKKKNLLKAMMDGLLDHFHCLIICNLLKSNENLLKGD